MPEIRGLIARLLSYQQPCALTAFAQSRVAIDRIAEGVAMSLFQASQQAFTMSL
jgi:hypothetical protein